MKQKILAALLGVLTCLALLEVGLRVVGRAFLERQEARNLASMQLPDAVRVMCIGESTTGLGGDASYPSQLEVVLNERSDSRTFRVINAGIPGADTSVILKELRHNLNRFRPHIVVAMMGANDIVAGIHHDSRVQAPRRAIPDLGIPVAEQKGFPYSFKTYRLILMLSMQLSQSQSENPARAAPPTPRSYDVGPAGGGLVERGENATGPGQRPIPAEQDPVWRSLDQAWQSQELADPRRAEALFRKAIMLDGANASAHAEFGLYLLLGSRKQEARTQFEKALTLSPDNVVANFGLGALLTQEHRCGEAESMFERAVRQDPAYGHAYVQLGHCYRANGDDEQAENAYLKAIKFKRMIPFLPLDQPTQERLTALYTVDPQASDTLAQLAFPVAANPQDLEGYVTLMDFYEAQGRNEELERIIEPIGRSSTSDVVLARISSYYQTQGRADLAARYAAKARTLRNCYNHSMTQKNYAQLRRVLSERGIKLVAVQYPTRPLASLKALIGDAPEVVFVDNEAVFREALSHTPYDALFWDHCYGDFGHATRLGNRILAESVASAILDWIDSAPRPRNGAME